MYREGHGFITVPDITHVLQTLGEKLAPDETQVQLPRRTRRYCYLLHLSTKLDSSDIDDVLSSVCWSADNVYLLRNSSRRLTSMEMETLTTKNS